MAIVANRNQATEACRPAADTTQIRPFGTTFQPGFPESKSDKTNEVDRLLHVHTPVFDRISTGVQATSS